MPAGLPDLYGAAPASAIARRLPHRDVRIPLPRQVRAWSPLDAVLRSRATAFGLPGEYRLRSTGEVVSDPDFTIHLEPALALRLIGCRRPPCLCCGQCREVVQRGMAGDESRSCLPADLGSVVAAAGNLGAVLPVAASYRGHMPGLLRVGYEAAFAPYVSTLRTRQERHARQPATSGQPTPKRSVAPSPGSRDALAPRPVSVCN
jgi:hypothetical protein